MDGIELSIETIAKIQESKERLKRLVKDAEAKLTKRIVDLQQEKYQKRRILEEVNTI